MKKDLAGLLIKECCQGKKCKECGFLNPNFHCYLQDIIKIVKENDNYEK